MLFYISIYFRLLSYKSTFKLTFFRWSLKLYGTQSDPNSDNSDDHAWYDEEQIEPVDWKENVVREAPLGNYLSIYIFYLSIKLCALPL